ncbi:hypothetical protein CPB97_006284 [Podila verticillata]|nr:hypothetical protein CPB97_006284 [Podila verticillata]
MADSALMNLPAHSHHDTERLQNDLSSLYHQHQHQQLQQQPQQPTSQPPDAPQAERSHDQQLESMTYLMQDITSPSRAPPHSHPHHLCDTEDELNIYDYIHQKQEDEEESEDHAVAKYNARLSTLPTSVPRPPPPPPPPPSSSSSNVAMSLASAPIPTSVSSMTSSLTTDPLNKGDQGSLNIHGMVNNNLGIMTTSTHMDPSGTSNDYMDSSMDIYGNTNSSFMPPYSDLMSPPTQDLFRMLMEELQTHAAMQRERFSASTTGDSMDSVDFLFNGQQVRPLPHFMFDPTIMDSPNMMASEPSLTSPAHTEHHHLSIVDPVPIQLDGNMHHQHHNHLHQQQGSHNPHSIQFTHHSHPTYLDESTMTSTTSASLGFHSTVTPSGAYVEPSTTRHSGSDAPKQVSDASTSTYCDSQMEEANSVSVSTSTSASASTSTSTSTSATSPPRAEVVRVAFTKISSHSSQSIQHTYATHSHDQVPVTELSFKSVSSGSHGRKASSAKRTLPSPPAVITMTASSRKKARFEDQGANISQESAISPSATIGSLPSPPSSVRTTPPLAPREETSPDFLELHGHTEEDDVNISEGRPVSPTSPLPPVVHVASAIPEPSKGKKTGPKATKAKKSKVTSEPETTIKGSPSPSSPTPSSPSQDSAVSKRPWTTEEETKLLELLDSMKPIREVAKLLNRSIHSVRSRRQVLTDPGFVKGHGHSQPRRSKPDPGSKLPTYSQMAFLSLARLPELQGTLNDVADMVEKLFSRHLNRIPRTGHKNLQIWRAQISDALAHEKGHPRPRFESFGLKRGRQWVYRLTEFGRGVAEAMGGVEKICDDLLKNNQQTDAAQENDGEKHSTGADAGIGKGEGYGYSYTAPGVKAGRKVRTSKKAQAGSTEEVNPESAAISNAITNAMAAMAAGLAAMTAAEDEKTGPGEKGSLPDEEVRTKRARKNTDGEKTRKKAKV